jgi:uncharacterized protein (DUF2235 family)
MAKKIILLSDGTGNSAGKVWRTNVWRVFELLDLKGSGQIAAYDDGVGSSSLKPLALLGGVFGWGLKRNVLSLYKFLCRNYKSKEDYIALGEQNPEDDQIYGFGFSRGAFTMRVVIGLVLDQGLVRFADESELDSQARKAYRAYQHRRYSRTNFQFLFRLVRILIDKATYTPHERTINEIEFLGLWDTVSAYGLPIDEMTRGVSQWLWPLELPSKRFNRYRIKRARHALSVDDERATFHPVLWNENAVNTKPAGTERSTSDEQLLQVWFVGVHSNVGGGYPDDSLANVSLAWMLAEAGQSGLRFKEFPSDDPDALLRVDSAKDKDGRLYDSRGGLGGYYRYSPRRISDFYDAMPRAPGSPAPVPKIHETVFGRIKVGAHPYAPIGLPARYEVVRSGDITVDRETFLPSPFQSTIVANAALLAEGDKAPVRHDVQQEVWNTVWRRRGIYFLTVFASIHLAVYPLYRDSYAFEEHRTPLRLISNSMRMLGSFLPPVASHWLDAYARDPPWFLMSASLVVFLTWSSVKLRESINDRMRAIWIRFLPGTAQPPKPAPPANWAQWLFRWLFVGGLLYVVFYPTFMKVGFLNGLRLPLTAHVALLNYTAQPVRFIIVTFLFIRYVPDRFVQWLRTRTLYQHSLRFLRYGLAPFVSALGILFGVVAFGSHLHFSMRDSFGDICASSKETEAALKVEPNQGFESYEDDKKLKREVIFDSSPNAPGNPLCMSTGVFVSADKRYRITVTRLADPANPTSLGKWSFWNEESFMGGQPVSRMPASKAVVLALLFPVRRNLGRPWGSMIFRIGRTGLDEEFVDRAPPEQNENLTFLNEADHAVPDKEAFSRILQPRRDGELFVYLNAPVLGIWRMESLIRNMIGNAGVSRIDVEVVD